MPRRCGAGLRAALSRPSSHLVLSLELPGFPAVSRLLAVPCERVVLDVHERPSYLGAVRIDAAKNNAITFQPALDVHEVVVFRADEDDAPQLAIRIEETNRSTNRALPGTVRRIGDPDVLQRAAVEDPPEPQLALLSQHSAIVEVKGEVAVPGADEAIERSRLVRNRRMWMLCAERRDHRLARVRQVMV